MNFSRSVAKDRVTSYLGNSYNPMTTISSGMEASGLEERASILGEAKRDAAATVGQATIDGYNQMGTASQKEEQGGMWKQIGGAAFNIGKMALAPATGGASSFVPNPFSFM